MNMVEKLKMLMAEKGINQHQLCMQTKIPYSTISNWFNNPETAQNAKLTPVRAICNYFAVSIDFLIDDSISDRSYGRKSDRQAFNVIDVNENDMHKVPIYGAIAASFGRCNEEEILGYEYTDQDNWKNCCWLRVDGESMEPELHPGDFVLIDKDAVVNNGDIVAARIDEDEATIKKYNYQSNVISLVPINPTFQVRTFARDEINRIRIVGKVTEIKRKY